MTALGGDMFILIYLAKTGEVKFINGTGFAPAASVDFYKSVGGLPDQGPLSVSVPGAVGAVDLAARAYGTRPLSGAVCARHRARRPRIPVTEALAGGLRGSRDKLGNAIFPKDLVQRRTSARNG